MKRKILVLYNSAEERTARDNSFIEGFAMPLNYLGFLYEIIDVSKRPLPGQKKMEEFHGIFTAFGSDYMVKPDEYLSWLLAQQQKGKKLIIAGSLGAYRDFDEQLASQDSIRKVFSNLGFSYRGNATTEKIKLGYGKIDSEMMNFERKLPIFPEVYVDITPSAATAQSWVTVKRKDYPAEVPGTAVGLGPGGGFALNGFMRWQDPVDFLKKWYLNPFEFLYRALELDGLPVFTPTTLNGRRVAFAHIDGDGFVGYTEIDNNKNCGEIVMERIFDRYDFPNSASVIAGEIDPDVRGSFDNVNQSREMFEKDNVETASHSYTHPFAWNAELRESKEYADEFVVGQYEKQDYKFNSRYEIVGSCEYITTKLAPPDKPCNVLFWSGMCDPVSEQIEIADKAGILNLNGGDTVMDARRNSYFGVSPLYKALGKFNQIYTGQANENILTNLWSGPYFGFRNIIETMKRTGSPRRIMPIDIYYHFYSGEKFASLKALEDVYEWVLSQDTARVYASSYIKMVNGFLSAVVEPLGNSRFRLTDYGECLSVRLDGPDRVPDLRRCVNVLGYDVQKEGIFVHLVSGSSSAELVLSTDSQINSGHVFIKYSSGWINDFRRTSKGARFLLDCFSKGDVALGGLPPETGYRVIRSGGTPIELKSNESGEIFINEISSGSVEIIRI